MHPPFAAGALVLALMIGGTACNPPTGMPDDPGRRAPPPGGATLLVVRSASDGHWLRAGDSLAVRLTIAADSAALRDGRVEGLLTYDGVPLWATAPAAPGEFITSYFTHEEIADRLIGLFSDADITRGRLLVFVRPEPFAITWVVTASGPDGAPVELARGDGIPAP